MEHTEHADSPRTFALPATRLRYLFALEKLCQENGGARAVEIAALLGVTRPSVHRMVETLKKQQHICQVGALLLLTAQGQQVLDYYREDFHIFLSFFQKQLGLSTLEAEDNAISLLGAISPRCGTVKFQLAGDDGYRLFVNDKLITGDWGNHSFSTRSAFMQVSDTPSVGTTHTVWLLSS